MELLIEHLGQGLMLSLLMSMPAILMAAGIGLVVGILQAVTQVQEQTIAAAPKIIGVFAVLLLGGGLMMNLMTDYLRQSFQVAFNDIPQDGIFILPPKARQAAGMARARQFFQIQAKSPANKLNSFESTKIPEDSDGNGIGLMLQTGKKQGSALGIAEKMSLQKDKH
jgi:flagellar biosynthesis protein FliQ